MVGDGEEEGLLDVEVGHCDLEEVVVVCAHHVSHDELPLAAIEASLAPGTLALADDRECIAVVAEELDGWLLG